MQHKFLRLFSTAVFALSISATCFADNLENVKFGDDFDQMQKLPKTHSVDIMTSPFAYDTLVQFESENVLDAKTYGIEYNFFKKALYEVNIIFKEDSIDNYEKISEKLTKKYGKSTDTNFSGETFIAKGREWVYKNNLYSLDYYHCNDTKKDYLCLTVKTNFYVPDEKDRSSQNFKPQTPKSYEDLEIFK